VLQYLQLNNSYKKRVRYNNLLLLFILTISIIGGRVLVFASNLCSIGYGPVKIRDDPKLYNTPNEKNILSPENDFYTKLA
jgi:hypothetical protein